MERKLKQRKINWKRGASELLSLAIALPIILMMIFAIVNVIQVGLVRQSLEYTAYLAGRSAVVCDTYDRGLNSAENAMRLSLSNSTFGIDPDDATIRIKLVAGTTAATGATRPDESGIRWEKGALAEITISTPQYNFMGIDIGEMKATIYMMVERPAKQYYS